MNEYKLACDLTKYDAETGEFWGLASTYGNVDRHGEIIAPGAFTRSLEQSSLYPLLWNHDMDTVLGVIELSDGPDGLAAHGVLNLDTQDGREKHALAKQGAIKGLSIGARIIGFDDVKRTYTDLELREVSLTPFPANEQAKVTAVKVDEPAPTSAVTHPYRDLEIRALCAR